MEKLSLWTRAGLSTAALFNLAMVTMCSPQPEHEPTDEKARLGRLLQDLDLSNFEGEKMRQFGLPVHWDNLVMANSSKFEVIVKPEVVKATLDDCAGDSSGAFSILFFDASEVGDRPLEIKYAPNAIFAYVGVDDDRLLVPELDEYGIPAEKSEKVSDNLRSLRVSSRIVAICSKIKGEFADVDRWVRQILTEQIPLMSVVKPIKPILDPLSII